MTNYFDLSDLCELGGGGGSRQGGDNLETKK